MNENLEKELKEDADKIVEKFVQTCQWAKERALEFLKTDDRLRELGKYTLIIGYRQELFSERTKLNFLLQLEIGPDVGVDQSDFARIGFEKTKNPNVVEKKLG